MKATFDVGSKSDRWIEIPKFFCLIAIVLEILVNSAHGLAHFAIPVPVTVAQGIFVVFVVYGFPILAAALLLKAYIKLGAILLLVSMAGAFLFGWINHYVVDSIDHVSRVPETGWGDVFRVTAFLLAGANIAGVVTAIWLLVADSNLKR